MKKYKKNNKIAMSNNEFKNEEIFVNPTDDLIETNTENNNKINEIVDKKEFKVSNFKKIEKTYKKTIQEIIVDVARSYVGEKEISENKEFEDKIFEFKMKEVGWKPKEAWCSYFVELIFKEAFKQYDTSYLEFLNKNFSGSSQLTYNNFKKNGKPFGFVTSMEPKIGSIVIWQSTKGFASGHIGIVTNYDSDMQKMLVVEGNTNYIGSREGNLSIEKIRNYTTMPTGNLKILGFVNINI
jgi:hypothetical protein